MRKAETTTTRNEYAVHGRRGGENFFRPVPLSLDPAGKALRFNMPWILAVVVLFVWCTTIVKRKNQVAEALADINAQPP